MLPYDICVALKKAGYPQKGNVWYQMKNTGKLRVVNSPNTGNADSNDEHDWYAIPTLEELIEACEKSKDDEDYLFTLQWWSNTEWRAGYLFYDTWHSKSGTGSTPSEAVASLYLAITK